MKISNTDLIALTEIKLYFSDPPTTFKLPVYAAERLEKAVEILTLYSSVNKENTGRLKAIQEEITGAALTVQEMKDKLKEAGRIIGALTSR